jgi:hypothetical protein
VQENAATPGCHGSWHNDTSKYLVSGCSSPQLLHFIGFDPYIKKYYLSFTEDLKKKSGWWYTYPAKNMSSIPN